MGKSDIGLKLLSLYRDITKPHLKKDDEAVDLYDRIKDAIESFEEYEVDEDLKIIELDEPSILPKQSDTTMVGRVKAAIAKHKARYGSYLSANELNLLRQVYGALEIDYEKLF